MKQHFLIHRIPSHRIVLFFTVLLFTGCASKPIDQIDLMPAPDVYGDGLLNPLPEDSPYAKIPYNGILYATDRWPASAEDEEKYYLNDRGQLLRLGVAGIKFGDKDISWEKARAVSMLKSRTEKYPITVENVDEWGILESSVPFFYNADPNDSNERPPDAASRYAEAINAQLKRSKHKHVYIYVHGYKVVYENPVLVSSELWHFLGYDGVFIAYAWPSTPSKFAYIKDSDTSGGFSRNLRLLIEFIAENTDAEQINILGYSNGTRLVTRALEQLAFIHQDQTPNDIYKKLRINNVILVGSDLDRGVFASYVADGLLNVSKHMTVYLSEHDKALGVSQLLTRRERLGQMWGAVGGEMSTRTQKALEDSTDRISFINVSPAEGASVGNGHGYFRSSPWASSDVLMTLYYGLTPTERGLVKQDDLPIYTFPTDYISRLWAAIEKKDPQFAKAYLAFKNSKPTKK